MTVELKNGDFYRGYLEEAQDTMNLTIKNCKKTDSYGKETMVEVAYIRGSHILFIVLPSMLSNAPFFERIKLWRQFKGHAQRGANTVEVGRGRGRGSFGRGGDRPGMQQGGPSRGPPGGVGMGRGLAPMGRGASAVVPAWQQASQMQRPPMGQNPYGQR